MSNYNFETIAEATDNETIVNALHESLGPSARRDAELAAPKLEHPQLRSLTEVQAERDAVARHNDYGWVRPDADACEICGRKAFATPVDGFQVRECTNCSRLVCEEHADADADCDQDGYFLTSWVCNGEARSECERLEAERGAA